MPYPRNLQQYTAPEFYADAPESWERRLREVSPVTPGLDHLVFRVFAPHESWSHSDRPMWTLYSARPTVMVEPSRALQFTKHWSELATEGEQVARKSVVSDYQHFMWHSRGLYVTPFWICQGEWGGTPAKYTDRERRYLDAVGAMSEAFPLGFFPACPFDERVVKQITARDRLLKAMNNYEALEKMDRSESKKADDEAAELLFRETYLKTWSETVQPQVEFMQSYLRKSESHQTLPDAPDGLANTVAQWREHFLETGQVLNANAPSIRTLQVAVA